MNRKEIEQYLQNKNTTFSSKVLDTIENERQEAIKRQDEQTANDYWCLEVIYYAQSSFVSIFDKLKAKKYTEAWEALRETDIQLTCLEDNYPFPEGEEDPYHLNLMKNTLPEYEKLFPYEYFVTREAVIKKQRCTICGKDVSLRDDCGHIPGKIYMGELCMHQITNMEYLGAKVVQDPFDKFEILKPYQMDYNYGMLDGLMQSLKSPYEFWYVDITKEKNPQFAKIGRNDPCPCGSGKKFKHCCMNDEQKMFFDHYTVHMMNEPGKKIGLGLKML